MGRRCGRGDLRLLRCGGPGERVCGRRRRRREERANGVAALPRPHRFSLPPPLRTRLPFRFAALRAPRAARKARTYALHYHTTLFTGVGLFGARISIPPVLRPSIPPQRVACHLAPFLSHSLCAYKIPSRFALSRRFLGVSTCVRRRLWHLFPYGGRTARGGRSWVGRALTSDHYQPRGWFRRWCSFRPSLPAWRTVTLRKQRVSLPYTCGGVARCWLAALQALRRLPTTRRTLAGVSRTLRRNGDIRIAHWLADAILPPRVRCRARVRACGATFGCQAALRRPLLWFRRAYLPFPRHQKTGLITTNPHAPRQQSTAW